MAQKYLAFDIETAKVTPGPVRDVKALRPLGVYCAAALLSRESVPRIWHGVTSNGMPPPRMTEAQVQQLIRDLEDYVEQGWTFVTSSGAGSLVDGAIHVAHDSTLHLLGTHNTIHDHTPCFSRSNVGSV
ncbi:MAG: hypothetical protein KDA86_13375 [Planctomycetaceae bacterium]|nr:hypothetical protein [Planctomycetaceae bacterium]